MKRPFSKRFNFALLFIFIILLLTVLFIWNNSFSGQTQNQYSVELAFPNLMFNHPVGLISPPDSSNRLFVIEQTGVIQVFENSQEVSTSNVFLDISNKVLYGGEQGLLGLVHPNYKTNGYFYVNYVTANPTRTVIARYTVSTNPNQALETSEQILLEINQPFSNHKGGQLAFGADGYLYFGLGDGGSEGDPSGNGQNLKTLLGKILRIDVDSPSGNLNYGIPQDNPYLDNTFGYREEIYAYGFRNPWRFSFDSANGRLWAGDVGQDRIEEIDVVEKGGNYGWKIMEGNLTYSAGDQTGLKLPVWDYSHSEGNAVIGGYVYRGLSLTELNSRYIYGDFGSGKIWALKYDSINPTSNTLLVDSDLTISSFGLDAKNTLYICSLNGQIYTLKNNSL
jgi:glucose/arabinose dehydrogenase